MRKALSIIKFYFLSLLNDATPRLRSGNAARPNLKNTPSRVSGCFPDPHDAASDGVLVEYYEEAATKRSGKTDETLRDMAPARLAIVAASSAYSLSTPSPLLRGKAYGSRYRGWRILEMGSKGFSMLEVLLAVSL